MILAFQLIEIRKIIYAESCVQLHQHNFYRIYLCVCEVLVRPEKVFQIADVLTKPCDLAEGFGRMGICSVAATDYDVAPIKPPSSSWEKVPCIATQNAYSLCGTTVTRLAAIKPFSTFRQVFLMFACPDS